MNEYRFVSVKKKITFTKHKLSYKGCHLQIPI